MDQSSKKQTEAPRPWDFAPGSLESRAAARAMLESCESGVRRLQIVTNVYLPGSCHDKTVPHIGPWQRTTDGGLMRMVYIPTDTDEETKQRLLASP